MKILVLGYSGAGKSTFAKKLHQHYNIPVIYLDTIHFKANWVEREDEDMAHDLRAFMSKNDSWVIEGNYRRIVPERHELADQIFIFKLSRLACLYGIIKRRIKYRKTQRESSAIGCKEKIDFSFFMWTILTGRTKKRRTFFKLIEEKRKDSVIVFKNRHQINTYLKNIGIKNH
ncbi:MAG: DNA topology modulation protein FlaR [Acholeplasmataceae bacterium]